ncbi:hypothetical protein QP175_19390 [Sphingomonas aerolata]|jgi:hypothetical protein|uniref:hypothetical protein n=1 Tax=Sphingomonas aerolata TaxID=185951 RepID=UPI002FE0374A
MLKTRMKRLATPNDSVFERLAGIECAMTVLGDEDILDLADITRLMPDTALTEMVRAEIAKRAISL